jgi:simple sugar transport system ATP-binding protein
MEPLLRTQALTKKFHQVVAIDSISFDVRPGEIHCLLGENGAGKSTLAECIYGFYKPEQGEIFVVGKPVQISSPAEAISHGIGMVHQHFVLVPTLSVLENIVVGTNTSGLLLDLAKAEKEVTRLCKRYCVEIDLQAKVWQLPVGQQQWVEILKVLYVGARLLILDEPTAVLTPQESHALFEILSMMTRENMSVILISHKLNEVLQSDRVTILRRGKKIATVKTSETNREKLTAMMIGRDVDISATKDDPVMGAEILVIQNLRAQDDRGQEALRGIDLVVREGEIVGIAGVAGNGQKELFETLIGVRKARSGQITLMGEEITSRSPKYIQGKGVAFIPEDRFAEGLVPDFSVEENLILGNQRAARFKSRGFIDFTRVADFAKKCITRYEIATPSGRTITRTLSGGNAQKLIVAREFAREAKLTLANQPSRGLDIGVIEYVHQILFEKRRDGGAILLASEDLDELYTIADTIVVIHKGQIMGRFPAAEADIQQIGLLMVGSGTDEFGVACRT